MSNYSWQSQGKNGQSTLLQSMDLLTYTLQKESKKNIPTIGVLIMNNKYSNKSLRLYRLVYLIYCYCYYFYIILYISENWVAGNIFIYAISLYINDDMGKNTKT